MLSLLYHHQYRVPPSIAATAIIRTTITVVVHLCLLLRTSNSFSTSIIVEPIIQRNFVRYCYNQHARTLFNRRLIHNTAAIKMVANDGDNSNYVGRFVGTNADENTEGRGGSSSSSSAASAHFSTSTKWSVLSERLQGLLLEASTINNGMESYCMEMSDMEGPIMKSIRTKMMNTDWKDLWDTKQTMFAYGEEMSTDPLEGQFIKALTTMKQPKHILEVGMFVGYGAAAMLEGSSSSTTIVSLEIDPYLKTWVTDCMLSSADDESNSNNNNIMDRFEIVTGPALETMPTLSSSSTFCSNDKKFDMVFIDANKSEYRQYVEILLKQNLLEDGAQLIVDNTLYCGMPYTDSKFDSQPARRQFGNDIKVFNSFVKNHPRLKQVILPIRDGVTVVVYKK